jgi:hypothetical protein
LKPKTKSLLQKLCAVIALILLILTVVYDARIHFDAELIHLKRQHKSAQKNWNLFYDQRYVYADSGFRYESDFNSIRRLIEPNSAVLSDISTSYYSSTYLPVYVKNIHRHHGRGDRNGISILLNSRQACYLQDPKNIVATAKFFKDHNGLMRKRALPELRYIIVNRDVRNLNLRQDCLWTARERVIAFVDSLADPMFEGEYLNLYRIK